jgi:hypothetical protein
VISTSRRVIGYVVVIACLLLAGVAGVAPQARAATTTISVNGTSAGLTFGGIGAISGASILRATGQPSCGSCCYPCGRCRISR